MDNEQLVIRIKAGIDVSENMLELYKQMKGLIYTIAKHYTGVAELDDLTQEGYIALCNAASSYEPSEGVKFASYAGTVIRRHLMRYIRKNQLVRTSEGTQAKVGRYKQIVNAFKTDCNRKPTDLEIRALMHISDKTLQYIKKSAEMGHVASLDSALTDDEEGYTLADTIPGSDDVEGDIIESVYQQQLKSAIWQAVDNLPSKQPEIIRKRFIDNMTRQAIGDDINIGREKVRAEEFKGLRTLKIKLRPFLPERMGSSAYVGSVGTFNRTWTSSTERCALELLGE